MKVVFKISLVILILSCIAFGYDVLYGNPISKYFATKQIKIFLVENSKGKNFEIIQVNKNIKAGGNYLAIVKEINSGIEYTVVATETTVVYHTLEDVSQLKKSNVSLYSPRVLSKLVICSFISFLISGVWIFVKWITKKEDILN